MAKKQYGAADNYERKLERVMERLGVEEFNFNWDRWSCWVQFRYKGELYQFEHSVEKARSRGQKLDYGSDAFAQVVLALEDLARMVERGIYELQTWVAGMKYLPPPVEVPSFFRFLGFEQIPSGPEEVTARYRTLVKQMHPDWVRSLRDQCRAAGVPFFLKQMGEWQLIKLTEPLDVRNKVTGDFETWPAGKEVFERVGRKAAGRLLDGRTWEEFPEVQHG